MGQAPGRALCPPWLAHLGRAPPPQGTTASEGTRGQGSCLALPTHLAPASGQQEGMVGAEPRLRGIRIHLPLTVPRGLCKTEGRGYRSFWNPAQTHCLHTHIPTHPHQGQGPRPHCWQPCPWPAVVPTFCALGTASAFSSLAAASARFSLVEATELLFSSVSSSFSSLQGESGLRGRRTCGTGNCGTGSHSRPVNTGQQHSAGEKGDTNCPLGSQGAGTERLWHGCHCLFSGEKPVGSAPSGCQRPHHGPGQGDEPPHTCGPSLGGQSEAAPSSSCSYTRPSKPS